MPLILVVEQDEGTAARLREAFTVGGPDAGGGWRVQHARSVEEAMNAVASEAPDLFVVATELEGAGNVLGPFARRQGGPGTVGLAPAAEADPDPEAVAGLGADVLLTKPVEGAEVRGAAARLLETTERPSRRGDDDEPKLTSHDIFGDLVEEVEREAREREVADPAPEAERPAPMPDRGPGTPPAKAPPGDAPGSGSRPAARPWADDDIERRLEQTLSGVLGGGSPRRGATPKDAEPHRPSNPPETPPVPPGPSDAPPVAPDGDSREAAKRPSRVESGAGDDEVDALLSRTLSGLDLGQKGQKAPKSRPPAGRRRASGGRDAPFDLSELEDLARTGRRGPAPPPRPDSPSPRAPAPEAGSPPPIPPRVEDRPAPPEEPASEAAAPAGPAAGGDGPASADRPPPVPSLPFAETLEEAPEPAGRVGASPEAEGHTPPALDDTAAGQGVPFGQYRLLERIGVGGMAEVWKARMTGVEGFQKTVAIKKILPHLTDSSDFVDMFIDEAKLAAQLNHANIIHIYDLGKIDGDYYIAMEYVEGENLRAILEAARDRGQPLPVGLGLHVAARLANALAHAHRKRDFEDRDLGLVHRDVSPQNVLIGYEGTIKLCDFGIVKAVSKASHTRMGALKGKLQYMSPEQAWGRSVDARSDIFSLGALLFEMLTGRRLFSGDSEMEVLEAVRECRVQAPGELDSEVPLEVDDLVLRALAADPDERFQSAGELGRRLDEVMAELRPAAGQPELSAYMHTLFAREDDEPGPMPTEPRVPPAPEADRKPGAAGAPRTGAGTGTGTGMEPVVVPAPGGDEREAAVAASAAGSAAEPAPEPEELPEEVADVDAATAAPAAVTDEPTAAADEPARASGEEGGPDVEAVEPVGEVEAEEGGRRGRGLLIAAVVLALIVVAVALWLVNRQRSPGGAPPAGETGVEAPSDTIVDPPPPALEGGGEEGSGEAGADEATGEGEPGQGAVTPETPPAEAGGGAGSEAEEPPAAGAATLSPEEIDRMLEERQAAREAQLRREFEEKERELAAQLEAARRAAAEPVPEPSAATGSERAPETAPQPATEPEPEAESEAPADGGTEPEPAEPAAGGSGPEPAPPATPPAGGSAAARPAVSDGEQGPAQNAAAGEPPPTARPEPQQEPEPAPQEPPEPEVEVGELVRPGPGVTPPKLVTFEKPEYPPIARRLRAQGVVVVAVLVDEDGAVTETRLEQAVSQKVGINEAALEAARGARYRPATKNGVRVKMWTTLRIPFRL